MAIKAARKRRTAAGSASVDSQQNTMRPAAGALGRVLTVSGSQAQVRLAVSAGDDARATVGKFLGIRAGAAVVVGVITKIATDPKVEEFATGNVDMLGEIKSDERGRRFFQRGVTEYPLIGDPVNAITQDELR